MDTSIGHLGFHHGQEFFYAHGTIWRADQANAVMPDGFRPARFESTVTAWNATGAAIYGLPRVQVITGT